MQVNPHLSFKGDCEAAFKFYEQRLGGKIQFLLTYGASPAAKDVSPEWRDKIIHATLQLGDSILAGVDTPPSHYQDPRGISLTLETKDPAEAERAFAALAEGGEVQMALQETFWAARFGMLTDRFGIPWMVNCGKAAQQQSA
ncbi:MAG TPA: VOC family protein [Candidatus Acidoferrales bacterium]|nr:VOC family protein [Candidatus Acidoferrales bacterium]